ncbi:MAG: ribose transport system ATP-binding protein [Actinomycetota bacterium]|jgi:ABC-type sugar transport system ATPase subunit|nr:ribose transport system ATP-binding protein [Actinomycetota bacterium]
MTALPQPLLAAHQISKSFPGIKALDDVSLELRAGEVHALIGENGAGKSTLISILAGAMKPDAGTLVRDGHEVHLDGPASARRHGIATIFQELSIEPWLDVTANVVLGNEPTIGRVFLSNRQADAVARNALRRVGASDLPLRALAAHLSTGQKQLVEIARALVLGSPVIIMDEPTSSLPAADVRRLLDIMRQLRHEGAAILFVSHRLDEIREIADRVTVLRGGRHVATAEVAELPSRRMIELMTGRTVDNLFPPRSTGIGDVVLRASGLTRQGVFEDVSFEVHSGEILGFAGLIGAGRSEVMRCIYGADPLDGGQVEVGGQRRQFKSPRAALDAGIAYLPEDRKDQGLVLQLPVEENIVMSTLRRFTRHGFMSGQKIRGVATEMIARLNVRGRTDTAVANLSGGNQQKVVIAKALVSQAKVFIFDEPTRGVDVGAKYEVYSLIQELAAQGAAIILVSSELPEVMNVAHRIVVMSAGRVSGHFHSSAFDEHEILSAAFAAFAAREESAGVT